MKPAVSRDPIKGILNAIRHTLKTLTTKLRVAGVECIGFKDDVF